jgi:putative holliday junction resolvase
MKVLGIDYGRRKIGLALSEGLFAEPLKILRYQNVSMLVGEIEKIVFELKIEKIVMGISEGKMAEETKEFAKKLQGEIKIPVVFQDETLSTREAQTLSIEAGIKRKKRKLMEDAYSATLILQNYLDSL